MRNLRTRFNQCFPNALTGQEKYFDKNDIRQDRYDVFKASSSIPFVCKPYVVQGVAYFDGALSDSVPVEKAFQLGCERVVVILSKPEQEIRSSKKDEKIAARIRKKYPAAADKICQRAQLYNESVALAQDHVRQGKALIIAPDDTCGVDTLKKDRSALHRLYEKGYADGARIASFLNCNL